MSKLAIIDLDGVVANVDARFAQALADAELAFVDKAYEKREYDNLYWRAVFNPEYVPMDTLIEGVYEALDQIQRDGYGVILLTSRPESMRRATENWLADKKLMTRSLSAFDLIHKPPAFQFTKTAVWKAGTIQMLHRLYGADDLLVIDDEEANRLAILAAYPDGGDFGTVRVVASLAEAVQGA